MFQCFHMLKINCYIIFIPFLFVCIFFGEWHCNFRTAFQFDDNFKCIQFLTDCLLFHTIFVYRIKSLQSGYFEHYWQANCVVMALGVKLLPHSMLNNEWKMISLNKWGKNTHKIFEYEHNLNIRIISIWNAKGIIAQALVRVAPTTVEKLIKNFVCLLSFDLKINIYMFKIVLQMGLQTNG